MAADSYAAQTAGFLTWFKSLPGATFHDDIAIQDLRDRGAGRGIVATSDIPAETVLFTIPRSHVICETISDLPRLIPDVFSQPNLQLFEASDLAVDGDGTDSESTTPRNWISLILMLLYEVLRDDASPWKPYLDVFPNGFDTLLFWNADDLENLSISPLRQRTGVAEAQRLFRRQILPVLLEHQAVFFPNDCPNLLTPGPDLTQLEQLVCRLGSVIMAYAFDLEKEGSENGDESDDQSENNEGWAEDKEGQTMMGLVPMADILNADASFNAYIEHGDDAFLTATTLRPIAKGAEILNYYGPLSNSELLRRYGYVTENHRRFDTLEAPIQSILECMAGQLYSDTATRATKLGQIWAMNDEDGFQKDEALIIDRDAADPGSDGQLDEEPHSVVISKDMVSKLRSVLVDVWKVPKSKMVDSDAEKRIVYSAIGSVLQDMSSAYGPPGSTGIVDRPRTRSEMAVYVVEGERMLLSMAMIHVQAKLEGCQPVERSAKRQRRN